MTQGTSTVSQSCVDIFNHCLPPAFVDACRQRMTRSLVMFDRAVAKPGMSDLAERISIAEQFPGYQQILSLGSPPVDVIADANHAAELARIGNDSQADWCRDQPERFPGFVASLPMNDPEGALLEAERATAELGAVGIQLYTNVNGRPLDRLESMRVLDWAGEHDIPVWLHPLRSSRTADYMDETISKFDLWWVLGWPHETSVCAGRLVFAGLFDRWPDLKIITHHGGGTLPMMEGRIAEGLQHLGTRYAPEDADAARTDLKEPPLTALKRFQADTATFGSRIAIDAAERFFGTEQILFATDFPFADIGQTIQSLRGCDKRIWTDNAIRLLGRRLTGSVDKLDRTLR